MSTPEVLENFFNALVDEIRGRKPEYLRDPFTVAEIYQNLVPYRTHRDRIGVEMNADYEDALLRLLAGESDLLVLESEAARSEIRTELDSPNPNTTVYRDYAAATVRLNPALAVQPGDVLDEGVPREGGKSDAAALESPAEEADEADEADGPEGAAEALEREAAVSEDGTGVEFEIDSVVDESVVARGHFDSPLVFRGRSRDRIRRHPIGDWSEHQRDASGDEPEERVAPYSESGPEEASEPVSEDVVEFVTDTEFDMADEKTLQDLVGTEADELETETVTMEGVVPLGDTLSDQNDTSTDTADGGSCRRCRAELPDREVLNFCPFCGTDQRLVACPACDEDLEQDWHFCVVCGTGMAGGGND